MASLLRNSNLHAVVERRRLRTWMRATRWAIAALIGSAMTAIACGRPNLEFSEEANATSSSRSSTGFSSLVARGGPRSRRSVWVLHAEPARAPAPGVAHVGCSGWHYKSWRRTIYPETLPAADWLRASFASVHRRAQQLVLSPAVRTDLCWLARAGPARLLLFGQGQPISDPHQALARAG